MQTPEKIAFIINPNSGRKSKKDFLKLISAKIDKKKYVPFYFETERAGHASKLVIECVNQGINIVVAVGGDGTMNEVATSAHKLGATLGIIPKGSGNGLARSLKIPMNTIKAIECINKANIGKIDVGTINDRFFFCTCGTGFDAKIGHKFSKSKKRGFVTYVKATLKEFSRYSSKKYRLKIDGKKIVRRAFLVTVANAGQYGNNAYISPKARMDDGKLEVCIFKPFPWYTSLFLGLRLFSRNIDRSKYTENIQGEKVVFRRRKTFRFHIDGEPVKFKGPVKINILPAALNVIAP